ncbi:hypothetical protein AB6A40_010495 [Gnathostoma spinigerum]|uniref:Choline/carnitine acyltransferase domain-containing protein n=1 Tax=Gnathostoma spinigerum TaxID=75299 RepID=A0ABD6F193_9BILA
MQSGIFLKCPNITNSLKEDECPEMSWIGAAFGATSPDGYGICYRFAGNHSICAHITSFKSSKDTDSHRFRQHLIDSFEEIAGIFE